MTRWRIGVVVLLVGTMAGFIGGGVKPARAAGPIDVYLIAGQSNATGQGYMANLPKDFKIDQHVLLFNSGLPHLNSGLAADVWLPLHQASESPDRFGPELGFGNRLRKLFPTHQIALIKHAHSGTNLYAEWNPGADSADTAHWGPQFKTFVDTVTAGIRALRDKGYTPTIRGMIWQQGESDNTDNHAGDYGANLAHFISRVRQQFSTPQLRFVYGYVYPPPCTDQGRDLIRQGEHDVDQNSGSPLAVKGALLVATDDLSQRADDPNSPLPDDHIHFGTAGILGLGVRMADKIAAIDVSATTPPTVPPVTTIPSDGNYQRFPDWNKQCEDRVAAFKNKPCDIIFIGDSITQNMSQAPTPAWGLVGGPVWDRVYANRNALNFGVGADKTQHVLWRLDHMDIHSLKPKVAVILIGVNNFEDSAPDIAEGIRAVLDKTLITFTQAKVILISVLPSNRGIDKYKEVNKTIKTFCDNRSVFYLDLFSKMPPVGDNFKGVGFDHVHLTVAGYELWATEMAPLLNRLLRPYE
jgi:lysophospholipase L1-like esterase